MAVVLSRASCLKSVEALFQIIWFGTKPYLKVPSLDLLDPFLTIAFSFLLQKYFPKETSASSLKSATSSVVDMVPSGIVTIGVGWGLSGVGIDILTKGMVVDGVEV